MVKREQMTRSCTEKWSVTEYVTWYTKYVYKIPYNIDIIGIIASSCTGKIMCNRKSNTIY